MRETILYLPRQIAKLLVALMVVFALQRLLFVSVLWHDCMAGGVANYLLCFFYAWSLDLSTACYVAAILLIPTTLYIFYPNLVLKNIQRRLLQLVLFVSTFIAYADIIVYKEMTVKIHFKLLSHLTHPQEVFQSISLKSWLIGLAIIGLSYFILNLLFFKLYPLEAPEFDKKRMVRIGTLVSFLVSAAVIFVGLRGGLQPIPINESKVYYCKTQILNDAAVNPSWSLLHSYLENRRSGNSNPYVFMEMGKARNEIVQLYQSKDSSALPLFSQKHPNIALLILESWSANVVGCCGGDKGLTPNFDRLSREGLLFTNAYCSGHTSDQGIPAILSAYPAQPIASIIANSSKYPKMRFLSADLAKIGYTSSFLFGGQLMYGNIKSYLYYSPFDHIIEQEDIPTTPELTGRLGIHDQVVFPLWKKEMDHLKPPFFSCMFTCSTHSPYDIPVSARINYGGEDKPFLNAVLYADSCLGAFFNEAKKTAWYANTIFVIVADHGHNTPREHDYNNPNHYHIPLLLVGGALATDFKGKQFNNYVSQTDIAATLLQALQLNHQQYNWSKPLTDTVRNFAFFNFYDGMGWVTPKGKLVWNKLTTPNYLVNTFSDSTQASKEKQKAEAYLQTLFQEYLDF